MGNRRQEAKHVDGHPQRSSGGASVAALSKPLMFPLFALPVALFSISWFICPYHRSSEAPTKKLQTIHSKGVWVSNLFIKNISVFAAFFFVQRLLQPCFLSPSPSSLAPDHRCFRLTTYAYMPTLPYLLYLPRLRIWLMLSCAFSYVVSRYLNFFSRSLMSPSELFFSSSRRFWISESSSNTNLHSHIAPVSFRSAYPHLTAGGLSPYAHFPNAFIDLGWRRQRIELPGCQLE